MWHFNQILHLNFYFIACYLCIRDMRQMYVKYTENIAKFSLLIFHSYAILLMNHECKWIIIMLSRQDTQSLFYVFVCVCVFVRTNNKRGVKAFSTQTFSKYVFDVVTRTFYFITTENPCYMGYKVREIIKSTNLQIELHFSMNKL